jgi:hypothetical protein
VLDMYTSTYECLWVGSGKLLLVLASTIILGSESRGVHDHISLSHDSQELSNLLYLSDIEVRSSFLVHLV